MIDDDNENDDLDLAVAVGDYGHSSFQHSRIPNDSFVDERLGLFRQ